jgi:hypothetical protein
MQFTLTVRCNYCSRHFPPSSLIRHSNNVSMCQQCEEKHVAALAALSGQRQPECCQCHKNIEQLAVEQGTGNPRMMVHLVDGLYGLFCHPCSDAYERKRRDLYGGTEYGKTKGIA